MKILLDSSVLFSAFLTERGVTGRFLTALLDRPDVELCLSESIVLETYSRLLRPGRVRERYRYGDDAVERYCTELARLSTLVDDAPAIEPVCRDPDDDHVLAAAVAADAALLVSGDQDLLSMGSFRGIPIVSVREGIDRLGLSGALG